MRIFVFGSNLAGRHGAGSAKEALEKHGAKYGQGVGLQGNSYAIPTKDFKLEVLPVPRIDFYVGRFIHFATSHTDLQFDVVPIGCGLAGYKPEQIAPLFRRAPDNVNLPKGWRDIRFPKEFRTKSGLLVATNANRLVVGERGAYWEFEKEHLFKECFQVPKASAYRMTPEWKNVVYYFEYRTLDSEKVKLYYQCKTVSYADYKVGKFYMAQDALEVN